MKQNRIPTFDEFIKENKQNIMSEKEQEYWLNKYSNPQELCDLIDKIPVKV